MLAYVLEMAATPPPPPLYKNNNKQTNNKQTKNKQNQHNNNDNNSKCGKYGSFEHLHFLFPLFSFRWKGKETDKEGGGGGGGGGCRQQNCSFYVSELFENR